MTNNNKILILEDEEIILESLDEFLEDLDYQTYPNNNGESALVTLKSVQVDVAIVDIRLPGISGYEFIKNAIKIYPDTQFIIHTGTPGDEIPTEIINLENVSDNIFYKPVPNLFLFDVEIRRLLGIK